MIMILPKKTETEVKPIFYKKFNNQHAPDFTGDIGSSLSLEGKMNQTDLLHRLYLKLPEVQNWIEKTLEKNAYRAIPVIDFSHTKLNSVFPKELLSKSKVVITKETVPFPSLSKMGMPEFLEMENMQMAGITYKDVFFVRDKFKNESLFFHEMVHIVQWETLGVNNFLLAYGAGLVQFGYADSPLEKMAYELQKNFDQSAVSDNVVKLIQKQTLDIWDSVAQLFG